MVITTITLMERVRLDMIDIHSHIIPGIDDGARDTAEALSLLRIAQEDGITHIVATPHINSGRFDNDDVNIMEGLALLKKIIIENNLSIQVAAACELRIDVGHMNRLKAGLIPHFSNYEGLKVILLEFPHSHIPPGSENFIKWLFSNGYKPIIAHPERNRDLLRQPSLLKSFISLGCLTQLTAGSITGQFGPEIESFSFQLLKENKVSVVASDAHNIKRRPPILSKAYKLVASEFGEKTATSLFIENPRAITKSLFNEI